MKRHISFWVLLAFLLLRSTGVVAQDRQPAVAGSFYPANAVALKTLLHQLFKDVKQQADSNIAALIVPHAGYVFSGPVAANGYAQIPIGKHYQNVFVIGISHRLPFRGASIWPHGNYITPLGKVPVNDSLANYLLQQNKILRFIPAAHQHEHSIEVQLPYLQYWLGRGFKLVPILVGDQNLTTARKLAEALHPWFNSNNLFIISSDFSHYPSDATAQKLDKETAEAILSGKPEKLQEVCREIAPNPPENVLTRLCGEGAVLTLMEMISGNPEYRYHEIIRQNSGASQAGDTTRVVGYCAISVIRGKGPGFSLRKSEKKYLLQLARNSIVTYLRTGNIPQITTNCSKQLKQPHGAFVTLMENGKLRGCIGQFNPTSSLCEVVRNMSIAAATKDTRFQRVNLKEMNSITIEISVLTPLQKIDHADEFIPGKQGIYMQKGNHSGTYLPQVAKETGWSREDMLGHCARDKAGIGWNGWKGADLYTYEAIVFGEKQP